MTRKQRIEALEYFYSKIGENLKFLVILDYHHTKKANELNFESLDNQINREKFSYLYSSKLIHRIAYNLEQGRHIFTINEKGEQKLKQLKGKHEYFNQKKK